MYGGKFRFQNRLGQPYSCREIYCFCFVLLCVRWQIPSTSTQGAYIRRGNLTEGFLCYDFGGLIFRGAYTWRGLFSEFYGMFFRVLYLHRVSFLPLLTLHFWCDPQIGCLNKIQVHKCLATQETNHLLKFSDLIKVCMSHH